MKTVTAKAWLTSPEYADENDANDPTKLYYSSIDVCMKQHGWLEVGTAEITLKTTMSKKDLILSMVETQEAKIKQIQGQAENEINNLRRKIMELQAIAYEAKA
jgi:hypothetical protein